MEMVMLETAVTGPHWSKPFHFCFVQCLTSSAGLAFVMPCINVPRCQIACKLTAKEIRLRESMREGPDQDGCAGHPHINSLSDVLCGEFARNVALLEP